MSLWTWLFGRKPDTKPKPPEVVPGQVWVLTQAKDDPWPRPHGYGRVFVLDVQGGWVLYSLGTSLFNEERMKADMFTAIYRRQS